MKNIMLIRIIAFIELLIGLTTLIGLMVYSSLSISQKPFNVLIFVCITSAISIAIGLGLFFHKDLARRILIFFSLYIVLTKIMVFLSLLQFTGEIIAFIPNSIKNAISVLYHSLIIAILNRKEIKEAFVKKI